MQSPVPISRFLRLRKAKVDENLRVAGPQKQPNGTPTTAKNEKPVSLRSLLTPRVVVVAGNYAFLALVDIAFRAIQPLFFSTPIHLGGLGLPPSTIGNILSAYGVLNGIFQVFFFSKLHNRWGSKKVFMAGIISSFPIFAAFPLINLLARSQGLSTTVWVIVAVQTIVSIGMNLSFGMRLGAR